MYSLTPSWQVELLNQLKGRGPVLSVPPQIKSLTRSHGLSFTHFAHDLSPLLKPYAFSLELNLTINTTMIVVDLAGSALSHIGMSCSMHPMVI